MRKYKFLKIVFTLLIISCSKNSGDDTPSTPVLDPSIVTYSRDVKPIIDRNCIACHNTDKADGSVKLTTFDEVKKAADRVIFRINDDDAPMPLSGKLPSAQIKTIEKWKTDGFQN
jgi:hypothetical protein